MTVLAETSFGIKYEGPALQGGRMPVREFSPALFALGELFTEASRALYPDRPPVSLDIHATNEGSFGVDLILTGIEGAWEATEQLFGSDGVSALINLKEIILGGGTIGLVEFIRWLRGRPIREAETTVVEPGIVRVKLADTTVEVPEQVLNLHESTTVRRSVKEVVKPLAHTEIEQFKAISEEEVTVAVGKADLPAFEQVEEPEEEEELEDGEREAIVQIAGIVWGKKWRFTEGAEDSGFFAEMADPAFLDDISKGVEVFREGDLLECVIQTQQRKVGTQLKAEHRIVKVKRHIASTEQLNIHRELGPGESDEPPSATNSA